MPQYIIYRKKGSKVVLIGYTPVVKNIRRAWGFFKREHKRKVHKDWQYHIYPMNHSRFWTYKDKKWQISSWYGNHKRQQYKIDTK